ncbi:MAG: hypothetical protein FWE50_01930 [Alphaproteobacteria bacterium]|nr:hypothetical protein [Alphaproteobacteria bacterium]
MPKEEFLSLMKNSGAIMLPVVTDEEIGVTRTSLQQLQAAIIPMAFIDFYKNVAGGIILGDAEVFGLSEFKRETPQIAYFVPSILQIGREFSGFPQMRGKTIFGRNGLFWFAFDAFGNCFMLSNVNLAPLRKYEDIYKAISDCLAVGKI